MTAINHADGVCYGSQAAQRVYAGSTLVWERFLPNALSGLAIWLDATMLNGADGSAVTFWFNAGNTTQPEQAYFLGAPSPVLRKNALKTKMPVVRFTQGQGRLRFANAAVDKNWTLIYVGRRWQLRGGRVVTALGTASNLLVGYHGTEMDVCYVEGWLTSSTTPVSTTAWKMYSADSTSVAVARFFINGVLYASGAATPAKGWGNTLNISGYTNDADIGTSQQADCEIAELMLYNRKLSDADRQKVEHYLRVKWL